MTPKQKLELRAGEIRQKLAELGGIAELSDEQRQEIDSLRSEYADVERRVGALAVADDKRQSRRATTIATPYRIWNSGRRSAGFSTRFSRGQNLPAPRGSCRKNSSSRAMRSPWRCSVRTGGR